MGQMERSWMRASYGVILAGGRGERFWPLSSRERPKPFLRLFGQKSLLRVTYERLLEIFAPEAIFLVVPPALESLSRNEIPELPQNNLLLEPEPKDTAFAIAYALRHLPDGVVAFFPSDHFVGDNKAFSQDLGQALEAAAQIEGLFALGVAPTYPATGYGYLERGEEVAPRVFRVQRFLEKPPKEKARELYRSGRHYWNAGIFVARREVWLSQFARYAPHILRGQGERISVDHALMERSQEVYMLPASFPWDDLGDWLALERHLKGEGDNLILARHVGLDTRGVIVYSAEDETIVTIGLQDLVIVREGKTTLVARKDRIQDLKVILRQIEQASSGEVS